MGKTKVMTVVGTRPEIIRLSQVIKRLDKYADHVLVHTGQNYDYELNEVFFRDLGLRKPDHFLSIDTGSLGSAIGDIFRKIEAVIKLEKPDAFLVLGDTNSCLAAYMARRYHIPIYHMEAGNRCFDFNVPEETNRRIIDHLADFNLVYTEHARRHLISEGLPHRRIYLTGSPMREVLNATTAGVESSQIITQLELKKNEFFVVSVHREENVDIQTNMLQIAGILNTLSDLYGFPIIVSTHPRTQKRIQELDGFVFSDLIKFSKPFGFFDYLRLQSDSLCTISDSGTIGEESAILGFSAITLRNSMERPETLDTGTLSLTGFDHDSVLNSIDYSIKSKLDSNPNIPADYMIEDTSNRVVRLILGTYNLSNKWHGIYD